MKKKILLVLAGVLAVVGGVIAMSAFEAHVVNVTARIENALNVMPEEIMFGTVFPQEKLERNLLVRLSDSFMEQAECSDRNLLVNGDFETPVVIDDAKWDVFVDGTTGLGWTVEWRSDIPSSWGGTTRPDPALQELHHGVNGWTSYEGAQYAELDTDWDGPGGSLNGEPASVRIYQDVSTMAGMKYRLSFAFSPRPGTTSSNNKLEVKWDGVEVGTIGPVAGGSDTDWSVYEYDLPAATSGTTLLEFTDKGDADSLGTFLDDVVLVECGRVTTVDYEIRQKPKPKDPEEVISDLPAWKWCLENGPTDAGDLDDSYYEHCYPILCGYLSKLPDGEPDNDTEVPAPHEPEGAVALGQLETEEDPEDDWTIDLVVPCFGGMCDQTYDEQVFGRPLDPRLESALFGCDLWIEVTGVH